MERPHASRPRGRLIGCRTGRRKGQREGRVLARLTPPRLPPLREPCHRAVLSPTREAALAGAPPSAAGPGSPKTRAPGLYRSRGRGDRSARLSPRSRETSQAAPAAPCPPPLRALAQLRLARLALGMRTRLPGPLHCVWDPGVRWRGPAFLPTCHGLGAACCVSARRTDARRDPLDPLGLSWANGQARPGKRWQGRKSIWLFQRRALEPGCLGL